jgi:hypothetical protein
MKFDMIGVAYRDRFNLPSCYVFCSALEKKI